MNTQKIQGSVANVRYRDEINEDTTENQSSKVVANILSFEEERDRLNLEKRVERAFYQAGKALKELHSRKLYRSTHKNFEEYCKDRFGFERRHSCRLIEAASVIDNLIAMCPNGTQNGLESETFVLPTSERQVRELVCLVPSEQFDCWQEAVNIAGGKVPSGRIVKEIVQRVRERTLIPINHFIGEVCLIVIKGNLELQGKSGHWCIINHVASFICKVRTWDREYTVSENNKTDWAAIIHAAQSTVTEPLEWAANYNGERNISLSN